MCSKQQDLMEILYNNVAFFYQQKLTLPEKLLLNYVFFLMIRPHIFQNWFQEDDLFFVIDQFPVCLSSWVFSPLTCPNNLGDLVWSSIKLFLLDFNGLARVQIRKHRLKLGFGDFLRLNCFWGLLNLQLKFYDFLLNVRMFLQFLNRYSLVLFVSEHFPQHIKEQRIHSRCLLWNTHTILLLNFLQNAQYFVCFPG